MKLLLMIMTLIATTGTFAEPMESLDLMGTVEPMEPSSYTVNVVRDGVKYQQTAYDMWSGEYPGPVIDIRSNKTGWFNSQTTVRGYYKLSNPGAKNTYKHKCTVNNSIYHPWADMSGYKNNVIAYYTLTAVQNYKVIKTYNADVTEDGFVSLNVGDQVNNVFLVGEGYCGATRQTAAGVKSGIEFACDLADETEYFQSTTNGEIDLAEQWLYLQCNEGHKVFVQDTDLLKQKHVTEGTIVDYGTVEGSK